MDSLDMGGKRNGELSVTPRFLIWASGWNMGLLTTKTGEAGGGFWRIVES